MPRVRSTANSNICIGTTCFPCLRANRMELTTSVQFGFPHLLQRSNVIWKHFILLHRRSLATIPGLRFGLDLLLRLSIDWSSNNKIICLIDWLNTGAYKFVYLLLLLLCQSRGASCFFQSSKDFIWDLAPEITSRAIAPHAVLVSSSSRLYSNPTQRSRLRDPDSTDPDFRHPDSDIQIRTFTICS